MNAACYYNDASTCSGSLWVCRSCGESFCQGHGHDSLAGINVECVACERARVLASVYSVPHATANDSEIGLEAYPTAPKTCGSTPGPWLHRRDRLEVWTAESAPFPNVPIADIRCSGCSGVGDGEAELNADLIAAAPELSAALEALRSAIAPLDFWAIPDEHRFAVGAAFDLAGTALRKAGKLLAAAALAAFLSLPAFAAPQPCRISVSAATQAELELFARTGPALALRLASGRPYKALGDVDAKVPSPRVPKIAAQAPKL